MRTFKIVLFVLIGLVLLAVAAVVALIFVDPSVYRNQIETRASAAFGREFKIAGPIRLERSLRPRITVEDISIGNPSWASDTHFATADKLSLQVALLPLLRGKLNALDVVFSGVNLYIEEGPDNANNYTFGKGGDRETRGVLPLVERMHVKNSVINYKTADGRSKRFEVNEARLWNIPGEPERVEARGSAQEMKFTILLTTDSAAELSGPQNPWSVELDIKGPNMALNLAGQMEQAFKWEQGDYRIKLWGKEADTLEELFGVDFPTSGPFELSASLNKNPESFRVTDIAALLQGPPQTPAIKVSNGEASGGQDEPVQLALQGQFGERPFTLRFASAQPFEGLSQKTPRPIETRLKLADLKLNIAGEVMPATATERLEFNAQLQGESLATLAQLLDTELPEAGPYQFSFHTQIAKGSINVSELKGSIEQAGLWQTLGVEQGQVSVKETGSVAASLNAMLDKAPLSLTFEGGPKAPEGTWPLKLEAATTGATIKGDGAVVTSENGKVLQIATHISGNRFESLGPLLGTSLPAIGKFDLRADVSSDGDVHAADNLRVQIKNNRFSGSARWEDQAPRPVLSGKLSAKRLSLSDFKTPSKTTSKSGRPGLLDRPIKLDALNAFDARLELKVKSVAESPMPLADVSSTVTLTNGKMSAPFRANLAGAPINGQIQFRRRNNVPAISLTATAGKIDVGETLKQLKIPETVSGTADTVELKASSTGKTLRALLAQPVFTLQIKPADLRYDIDIGDREFDFQIKSAALVADKDQPLTGAFKGTLRGSSFNAEASSANLKQIRKTDTPLPLRLTIQTEDLQFQAEGTIFRPFENNAFELSYELAGAEIRGLDPLADYVLPLRGEFRTRGRVTARGNRFTYEEDLRVGQSDLKANAVILRGSPRPKVTGHLLSTQIHMDDMQLIDVDKEATPTRDESRVIPDYTLPIDEFFAVDADVDIKAERIRTQLGDLGEFFTKISLKNGRLNYSLSVAGYTGGQLTGEFDLNAAADPPLTQVQLKATDINFGFLLSSFGVTDYLEGNVDLFVDLSGSGNTRYSMLGNAEGRIAIIGGPGRISGQRIDLWAADLIPTMLSSQWQRENETETNCFVAHIELGEGRAEIEDLLLDTQRITIAASGILNLETEELDVVMAPRPKRASLVSLANPVRIQGTLAEPEVSVTRIPRRGRLAGAGLLAGLVNPAFLIFALSDTGTGDANPCEAVVEQAREAAGISSQESQNTN
jgi:uncharacterized protein involved in outer membrane biogenesis